MIGKIKFKRIMPEIPADSIEIIKSHGVTVGFKRIEYLTVGEIVNRYGKESEHLLKGIKIGNNKTEKR